MQGAAGGVLSASRLVFTAVRKEIDMALDIVCPIS